MEYYHVLIRPLRHVAERCGYALAVHGSLRRDIDLVACPWRDSAIDAGSLVEHLRKTAEVIIGFCHERKADVGRQPDKKPCGRLAWSFYLRHDDEPPYLDISVMPKVEENRMEVTDRIGEYRVSGFCGC